MQTSLELIEICNLAWKAGFMAGFSGNASLRLDSNQILITGQGIGKGLLKPEDLLTLNLLGEISAGSGKPSSEAAMHLAIYQQYSEISAILHTHPPNLQILELAGIKQSDFLRLPLYESEYWRQRLAFAAPGLPGTQQAAQNAAAAFQKLARQPLPGAIWLPGHGLCALGTSLKQCLGITEELEHLAKAQLASRVLTSRL